MYQIPLNNKKWDMKVIDRQKDKLRQVFKKEKAKNAKNGYLKGIRQKKNGFHYYSFLKEHRKCEYIQDVYTNVSGTQLFL